MSSSTSNSKQKRFLLWVAAILTLVWCVMAVMPWGGIAMSQRSYIELAGRLGADADYLIVGDSKAGPFSTKCLIPWLRPYRGVVFTADSVTPVFHWYMLREIRNKFPEFKPKVVFILIGANNMNANGLHAQRDFTLFNQVGLSEAWDLSSKRGDKLLFTEILLARVFPLYGHRVLVTHLQVGERRGRVCTSASDSIFAYKGPFQFEFEPRDPVADRNYYDIYRRSAYANYESSVAMTGGLENLIRLIQGFGGVPILVMPPVAAEMMALEDELVGENFDQTIASVIQETGVQLLDLRRANRFEFRDINHLSKHGAYDLAQEYFRPVLEENVNLSQLESLEP